MKEHNYTSRIYKMLYLGRDGRKKKCMLGEEQEFYWRSEGVSLCYDISVILRQHTNNSKSHCECRAKVAEWFTAQYLLRAAQMVVGLFPGPSRTSTNACGHVCKCVDWKPCWPLYSQQLSHQRWIWGSHKRESIQGIHPGFETQGRRHQKSKTRSISGPTKRTYVLKKGHTVIDKLSYWL